MKNVAIVLAGGSGSRMGASCPKQYLELHDKPILYYSLATFEQCAIIDSIILVTRKEDVAYCRREIVEKYNLNKVYAVVPGGAERYLSVYEGLKACASESDEDCIVYVHDGARPFADDEMIGRLYEDVLQYGTAVAAVPSKDTVKIADANGYVEATPPRNCVWNIQTPQAFRLTALRKAYERMLKQSPEQPVTDDAMVMEQYADIRVHLTMGSYRNLKITTPEDMIYASAVLEPKNM